MNERLERIHAEFQTPESTVADFVNDEAKLHYQSREKIVAGEANEVYRIKADEGDYTLRIAQREEGDFAMEKWAKQACEKVGVPVTKTVKIDSLKTDNGPAQVSLEEFIPGKIPDIWNEPEESWLPVFREAGEILGKMHSIRVDGFGSLDAKGHGQYPDLRSYIKEDKVESKNFYLDIAERHNISQDLVAAAIDQLGELSEKYNSDQAYFNHGDFAPKHFVVGEDGHIKAVLDFGCSEGADPVKAFADWDFWFGEKCSSDVLRELYPNKKIFSEDFEEKKRMYGILKALDLVYYYDEIGDEPGMKMAVEKLRNLITVNKR